MKPKPNPIQVETAVFNALAHPSRLEILELLRDGEACVCHIQAMLNQRQAYISQHLNVLRNAGLVSNRKEGLRVYYQIRDPMLFAVIDSLKTYLKGIDAWQVDETAEEQPRKPCTCPQCTEKHENAPREASYA
jgi:DNA-binding transcriptional ArsR family regulator